jgi:hypothetical protein
VAVSPDSDSGSALSSELGAETGPEATGIPGPRTAPSPQAVGYEDHGPVAADIGSGAGQQNQWSSDDQDRWPRVAAPALSTTDFADTGTADKLAASADAADPAITAPATDPLVDTSADPSAAPTHRRSRTGAATAAPTRRRARTATGRPAIR